MNPVTLRSMQIAADLYVSFYRAGNSFNASIDLAARQLADANSGTDFATQRDLVREAVEALV